ncbi:heparan-alpha-glucosaminide N-acetyltransferase [Archaeoglobus sp.]
MRYWEIDFLRGVGIILMLISNFVTDLQIFLNYPHSFFWHVFAMFTASIFIYTSGASFYVFYSKSKNFDKILKRFAKLMGLGFLITVVTMLLFKEGTIYFGILHFLALAWILAIPFYRLKSLILPIALLFVLLYPIADSVHAQTLALLPLGVTPPSFYTFDYFPVFPWFGIFLIGFKFGDAVMKSKVRKVRYFDFVCFLGRNSLKIYIVHQPVFVSIILILFGDRSGVLKINF